MRVLSLNVNGVRAACRKGFFALLERESPDLLCLQELKAFAELCPVPSGYHPVWHPAERPGYSGVGLLSRSLPERVVLGMGCEAYDREGRVLRADFGGLTVVNVYAPSGSIGEHRQGFKLRFLEDFRAFVADVLAEGRELLLCGDLNVAHQKIDLKNWRNNLTTSGFLPEERAWFSRLLELGLVDTVRRHLGPEAAIYSWWSLRSGARERNVGWRLDYQLATPTLAALIVRAEIPRTPVLSDHAPVILDYAWPFANLGIETSEKPPR